MTTAFWGHKRPELGGDVGEFSLALHPLPGAACAPCASASPTHRACEQSGSIVQGHVPVLPGSPHQPQSPPQIRRSLYMCAFVNWYLRGPQRWWKCNTSSRQQRSPGVLLRAGREGTRASQSALTTTRNGTAVSQRFLLAIPRYVTEALQHCLHSVRKDLTCNSAHSTLQGTV